MKKTILFFVTCLGFMGCIVPDQVWKKPDIDEKILNVQRVLMHEANDYTLLVSIPNSTELKMRRIKWLADTHFFTDVPTNLDMWARFYRYVQSNGERGMILEVHIHSAKDINGAGWNHGKFGSGMTTVIE